MIKKESQVALKIDTDTANDKRKEGTAFSIHNLEVDNNGGVLSLSAIKDELYFEGSLEISTIHTAIIIDNKLFVLVSIYESGYGSSLLYYDEDVPGFERILHTDLVHNDPNKKVDMIANKENENIIKLYWAYEGEQLCSFNIYDSVYFGGTISVNSETNVRNIKPVSLEAPAITDVLEGGNLKAGRIQYAYSMFNLGGVETTLSPLSPLVSISREYKGGSTGEVMPISMQLHLFPDTANYKYVRIFSIHYTELDQIPEIKLILEREATSSMTIIDDGSLFITSYTPEQLLFLGGTLLYPKTLATKNNMLFAGNFKSTSFDIPFKNGIYGYPNTDCRVYSFNASHQSTISSGSDVGESELITVTSSGLQYGLVPEDFDCVNTNLVTQKYKDDGVTEGATGPNFHLTFNTQVLSKALDSTYSMKQGEIYRVGCVWYDEFMRPSPVKWMTDIKVPRYEDFNKAVYLASEFKGSIQHFLDVGAVSYQLVVALRRPRDRTVSSQGFINPGAEYFWSYDGTPVGEPATDAVQPYYTLKSIKPYDPGVTEPGGNIAVDFTDNRDMEGTNTGDPNSEVALPKKNDAIQFFWSSDTIFDMDNVQSYAKVNILNTLFTGNNTSCNTRLRSFENGGVKTTWEGRGLTYVKPSNTFPGEIFPDFMLAATEEPSYIANFEYILSHLFKTLAAASSPKQLDLEANTLPLRANSSGTIDGTKVASYIDIPRMVYRNHTQIFNSYSGVMANCQVLKFSSSDWHEIPGGVPYSIFKPYTDLDTYEMALPLVELERVLANQYGGSSYEAKQLSTYVFKGKVCRLIDSPDGAHYIGDVLLGPIIINRHDGLDSRVGNYSNLYDYVYGANVEHNVDIKSRYDSMYSREGGLGADLLGSYRLDDNHQLASAYKQQDTLKTATGKPVTFRDVNNFEASIIPSNIKFPNESVDSWTEFLPAEIMNLQGTYGPLNKLYNFKNEVYAFQDTATSHILIQPRTQIQTDSAIGVELGTGAILYDADYLNTKSGCISMQGIADDGNMMLYYDNITNSINILGGDELSTVEAISVLMESLKPDNPYLVTFTYDTNRHEFIFAFENVGAQLVYNTLIKGFQRTQDGYIFVFTYKGNIYNKANYRRTAVYQLFADSARLPGKLSYIFAPESRLDKVFHFLEFRPRGTVEVENLKVTGSASRAEGEIVNPKHSSKFGITRIHLPRINGKRERFRDTSIIVDVDVVLGDESFLDEMTIMYNTKG